MPQITREHLRLEESKSLQADLWSRRTGQRGWLSFVSPCCRLPWNWPPQDDVYEDMAQKFVEHFLRIAGAMDRIGINSDELWDEEDGFFYDLLSLPDGSGQRIKVRSLVGLLPLCASTVIAPEVMDRFPNFIGKIDRFCQRNENLVANTASLTKPGYGGRYILSILNAEKLRRVLTRMLDEERFFSQHGLRALSRWHKDHPYVLKVHGQEYRVEYMPAECTNAMFGGNSNWRGPVWMPINARIVRALLSLYRYYGKAFTIECPTGSGEQMTLFEVAKELSRRLVSTFLNDANGRRPVFGGTRKFQEIRTGMTAFCFTNTSTATTGRELEPATRRAGRESWRS